MPLKIEVSDTPDSMGAFKVKIGEIGTLHVKDRYLAQGMPRVLEQVYELAQKELATELRKLLKIGD